MNVGLRGTQGTKPDQEAYHCGIFKGEREENKRNREKRERGGARGANPNLIKKLATPPYVASLCRSPLLLRVTKDPTPFAHRDPNTSIQPFALNLIASEVGR